MKLKQCQNIFHVIVNTNLLVRNVIKIKIGIIKHVNLSVKIKKTCALTLVFVRLASI